MNRKIISMVLVLMLCLSLTVSVSAEGKAIDFVIDEYGYLSEGELNELNELALSIYESTGVGIFFVYTQSATLADYDISQILNGITDYVIMMENQTSWFAFYGGKGTAIDAAAEETLRGIYDATSTYVQGVEDFLNAAAKYFPVVTDAPMVDASYEAEYLLYDEADLLAADEEEYLTERLLDVSHTHNAQIVIVTIPSMEGGDVDEYLEYLYDGMGFGYGDQHDGVLLLVCMDPREYRILSNGFAGVAIDTYDIDSIGDAFVSDLSDGNYADAFDEFIDQCDSYLDGYLNGYPFDFGMSLMVSLLIGAVVGLIVALVLKGQLKSVRKQNQANSYVKSDSMRLTLQNDVFLYRNVTKTRKETNNNSSRGGGGGGGSARSTGGGSF